MSWICLTDRNRKQEPLGIFSSQEASGLIPALITTKFLHFHLISNDQVKAELVVTKTLSAEMFH